MNPDPIHRAAIAERVLLGAVLRYPACLDDVAPLMHEHHFREPIHGLVWRGIAALYSAGRPVDSVILADWLFRAKLAGEFGEGTAMHAYLAELWDAVPNGASATLHASLVRDLSLLRGLSESAARIADYAARPSGPALEMLALAEREIFGLAENGLSCAALPLRSAIDAAFGQIAERSARPSQSLSGVPSGLTDLDALTSGLQNGELVVIAARPSVGKTALGATIAKHAAESGHPVLFCSLEMSCHELATRLLVAVSGIDGNAIRHAAIPYHDLPRLGDARDLLRDLPGWIDDEPKQSVMRIAANVRRLKRQHKLALVIVDYLQLIEPDDRSSPRHEQVGAISRALKALAREAQIPVVAMAQLNRGLEGRADQRPKLSDLRESGSIEADADVVVLLHKPVDMPAYLDLIIAKQRNGPVGELRVHFDRARMRFTDAPDHLATPWSA